MTQHIAEMPHIFCWNSDDDDMMIHASESISKKQYQIVIHYDAIYTYWRKNKFLLTEEFYFI